jgi:hypothetical protein
VESADQAPEVLQRGVGQGPGRGGREGQVTLDEGQDVPPLLVRAEEPGGPVETHVVEVQQQAAHGRRGPAGGPTDRVTDADHACGRIHASGERLLVSHGGSVPHDDGYV